jgi:hypothetical protein
MASSEMSSYWENAAALGRSGSHWVALGRTGSHWVALVVHPRELHGRWTPPLARFATAIRAVDNLLPITLPLLAPRERALAGRTNLRRQIRFLHSLRHAHLPRPTRLRTPPTRTKKKTISRSKFWPKRCRQLVPVGEREPIHQACNCNMHQKSLINTLGLHRERA